MTSKPYLLTYRTFQGRSMQRAWLGKKPEKIRMSDTLQSKPIEATPEQEMLAEAYAILRQVKHVLKLLEPSPGSMADTKAAVRDFCIAHEAKVRDGGKNQTTSSAS